MYKNVPFEQMMICSHHTAHTGPKALLKFK